MPMKLATATVGLTLCMAWAAPSLAAITGPVHIETGLVSGGATKDPSVTVFRGLPYAAPPVGDLRWRPPAPPKAWDGVRKADQPGTICPQPPGGGGGGGLTMSEDCLNLDVWTAASSSSERRPVMVWFHGGGAGMGAGTGPQQDGEPLAKKGVVLVNVNFRAGPLGHLASPELSKESGHNASGNYGIMDAVAALKWLKTNIAAFGGDPNNVTLFGQSFGAGTEHFITLSPMSQGLFNKVIYQSHAHYAHDPELMAIGSAYRTKQQAEADGVVYENALGTHDLKEMRAMPWQKLMAAYSATALEENAAARANGAKGINWLYIIDGYVVPHTYSESYALGVHTDAAVMAGNNHDEGGASPDSAWDLIAAGSKARAAFPALTKLSDYQGWAREKFGPMTDAFLKLYPAASDRDAFFSSSAANRDSNRMSTWMWATDWKRKNTKPAFLYFWTHGPPGPNHDMQGASHGSELAYIFGHPTAAWTADDQRISDMMETYWTNFAKTGNPNGPGLPVWSPFDGKTEQLMELGDHFQPIPLADKAKADFWRRFYASQPAR
jgi:para-nitrobenzyl esterase